LSSGIDNLTGDQNTFVGVGTGEGISSGTASTLGSNLVLVGAFADVGVDGVSNAVALGSSSVVGANNSVAIGPGTVTANANTIILGDGTPAYEVGIGTNAPQGPLDVNLGIQSAYFEANSNVTSGIVQFDNAGTGDASVRFGITGDNYVAGIDNSDNDAFKISAGTILTDANDDFAIAPSGNVGIGTATPGTTLEVFGTTTASSGTASPQLVIENTLNNDASINFTEPASDWAVGLDFSDGQSFKISSNPAIGTNDRMRINRTTGEVSFFQAAGTRPLTLNTPGTGGHALEVTNGTIQSVFGMNGASAGYAGTQSTHDFWLQTDGAIRMYVESTGEIGVNTLTPSIGVSLDVEGTLEINSIRQDNITEISGLYTITATDYLVVANGGSTISIPAGFEIGKTLIISVAAPSGVDLSGAETFLDGQSSFTLGINPGNIQSINIVKINATEWSVVSSHTQP
jgi:hypothetical protein